MYKNAILHFKKVDPILYNLAKSQTPFVLEIAPDLFTRLTRSIIGQQLSVKASSAIYLRFEKLFKNKINPKEILDLKDDDVRKSGISYPKIKYIKDLALKTYTKKLILESLKNSSEEIVIAQLTKVKGIGTWSAEMFLMFALGREDVFSLGDLGLKNAIKKHYKIEDINTEIMLEISKKWSPYRTYACKILWTSLDNQPK